MATYGVGFDKRTDGILRRAFGFLIRMVRDKGVEDRITYITFSRNAFDGFVAKGGRPVFYLNGVSPEVLKEIGGSGADYHINIFRKNPEWIGRLHSMGMPVNIWTVDSEADIQWCIDHGADYITTNEPELAMRLVEEAYQPRKLRVMTYNLRFGELADMDRLAREIKAAEPDFVAIQEVDVNTNRDLARHNNGLNYVSELAQRTGMFGHYARTLNFGRKGYYGIGILSRHPAVRVEKLELPALAAGEVVHGRTQHRYRLFFRLGIEIAAYYGGKHVPFLKVRQPLRPTICRWFRKLR